MSTATTIQMMVCTPATRSPIDPMPGHRASFLYAFNPPLCDRDHIITVIPSDYADKFEVDTAVNHDRTAVTVVVKPIDRSASDWLTLRHVHTRDLEFHISLRHGSETS